MMSELLLLHIYCNLQLGPIPILREWHLVKSQIIIKKVAPRLQRHVLKFIKVANHETHRFTFSSRLEDPEHLNIIQL